MHFGALFSFSTVNLRKVGNSEVERTSPKSKVILVCHGFDKIRTVGRRESMVGFGILKVVAHYFIIGGHNMKKKLLAMMLGAGLVLGACGGGNDDNTGDTNNDANTGTSGGGETASADAEAAYQKSCIGCHGGNLEGASGPELSDVGSRLSEDEIHTIILEGKGNMPPGLLKDEEADAVAKWLSEKK